MRIRNDKENGFVKKICRKPIPSDFTMRELDALMAKCECEKFTGGRGSGVGYVHGETRRVLQFDEPHPGKQLYKYQVKKVIQFIKDIGEIK